MSEVSNPWAVDQYWSLACKESGHTAGNEQSFISVPPLVTLPPEPPPNCGNIPPSLCKICLSQRVVFRCRKVGDHCSMCFQNNLMLFFPYQNTTFRRSFLGISIAKMQALSLWCLNFNICDLTWKHGNIEKTVHSVSTKEI